MNKVLTLSLLLLVFISGQVGATGSGAGRSGAQYDCSSETTFNDNEWRLISLPCDPDNRTIGDIFSSFTGDYGIDWVVFTYDPVSKSHTNLRIDGVMNPGEGYWVIQKNGQRRKVTLTGKTARTTTGNYICGGPDGCVWLGLNNYGSNSAILTSGEKTSHLKGNPWPYAVSGDDFRMRGYGGDSLLREEETHPWSTGEDPNLNVLSSTVYTYDSHDGYVAHDMSEPDRSIDPWDGFWVTTLEGAGELNELVLVTSPADPSNRSDELPTTVVPPITGNWTLTFKDDFNGNSLDPGKWRIGGHDLGLSITKAGNSGNNIVVRNGNVELIAEKKPMTFGSKHFDYASGEISTFQNFRQAYGYFEARIKYDAFQGVWPAFWTMPDRGGYGNENLNSESFMRFDLSTISQVVTKALLKIKVTDIETITDNSDNKLLYNIAIHRLLSSDWNENDLTWNNKPAYDPVWLRQFSGSDDSGLINEIIIDQDLIIDVTDYVNAQIAANKHAEFAVVDNFMRHNKVTFGSKEASNISDRPRLEIDGNDVYPVDDAYVKAGNQASNNFGDLPELEVKDPYHRTSDVYDGGAEIDIMESQGVWGADTIEHVTHWREYGNPERQTIGSDPITSAPTADGYHNYGMYWEPGRIKFYIDGVNTATFEDQRITSISAYIRLSYYLGGWDSGWQNGSYVEGFDNRLIRDDLLPTTMYIDHVYVWSGSPF